MSFRYYGFVDSDCSKPCTTADFIKKYSSILDEIIDHPDAFILLADFGGGLPLARYLKENYFRNGTLYHLGDEPKINIANLSHTKGGFLSEEECTLQIRKDSTVVYLL